MFPVPELDQTWIYASRTFQVQKGKNDLHTLSIVSSLHPACMFSYAYTCVRFPCTALSEIWRVSALRARSNMCTAHRIHYGRYRNTIMYAIREKFFVLLAGG